MYDLKRLTTVFLGCVRTGSEDIHAREALAVEGDVVSVRLQVLTFRRVGDGDGGLEHKVARVLVEGTGREERERLEKGQRI